MNNNNNCHLPCAFVLFALCAIFGSVAAESQQPNGSPASSSASVFHVPFEGNVAASALFGFGGLLCLVYGFMGAGFGKKK